MNNLYGSLNNRLMERTESKVPIVGEGATIYMYSDSVACTVIEVISKCKIVIQRDSAKCIGGAYSNEWELERNPNGRKYECYCRNGIWKVKDSKERVVIGRRDEWYDYSF